MRTLIDIPDHVLKVYDTVAKMKKISRAELVRQTLEEDIVRQRRELRRMAYGAWKADPVDGLALQRHMRDEEWD
jgi:metal-responsive CopG/Arc/MetJ family transcriptional regulator